MPNRLLAPINATTSANYRPNVRLNEASGNTVEATVGYRLNVPITGFSGYIKKKMAFGPAIAPNAWGQVNLGMDVNNTGG